MNCRLCNKIILNPYKSQQYCGNWRDKSSCGYKNRLIRSRKDGKVWRENGGKARRNYNPLTQRKAKLKKNFGLTLEDFDFLLKKQKGVCAICFKKQSAKYTEYLCVDHDHNTGKVRGLLCQNCNMGIGFMKDNPEILMNAIKYIKS